MSGNLVGELILWLIVAIVVIVIAVYIVNWLYHRSSKEVSFVRTGFLGERVVINGGAAKMSRASRPPPPSRWRRTASNSYRLPSPTSTSPTLNTTTPRIAATPKV